MRYLQELLSLYYGFMSELCQTSNKFETIVFLWFHHDKI